MDESTKDRLRMTIAVTVGVLVGLSAPLALVAVLDHMFKDVPDAGFGLAPILVFVVWPFSTLLGLALGLTAGSTANHVALRLRWRAYRAEMQNAAERSPRG